MIKKITIIMCEFSTTDERIITATFKLLQKEGFSKTTTKKKVVLLFFDKPIL